MHILLNMPDDVAQDVMDVLKEYVVYCEKSTIKQTPLKDKLQQIKQTKKPAKVEDVDKANGVIVNL